MEWVVVDGWVGCVRVAERRWETFNELACVCVSKVDEEVDEVSAEGDGFVEDPPLTLSAFSSSSSSSSSSSTDESS